MYYVYEFYIVETGEIIYAGKGTKNRYKVKSQRNQFLTNMLKRYNCDSRIVKRFENEEDAFSFEYDYIKSLKDKGQCVCNIYNGGAGGSGEYWTDELREEYSQKNVMKSDIQRKRMSDNNPMKNKEVSQRVNSLKKRPVIIGTKEYSSVKEAHDILGVATDTIIRWCQKGINGKGELCRYKDSEQVVFTDKRYNKGGCKGLTYKGKHYESPVDLADEMHCNVTKLYHWLKNGFDHYGNPIRYDDDNRELVFKMRRGSNHPVIVNGKHYSSVSAASRDIGVSSQWLGDILRGKHKSTKYICKYDNQQPSHGNTDNSTVEGSTTNG